MSLSQRGVPANCLLPEHAGKLVLFTTIYPSLSMIMNLKLFWSVYHYDIFAISKTVFLNNLVFGNRMDNRQ